jgi:tetratricopeptide (TPR) repeat protein
LLPSREFQDLCRRVPTAAVPLGARARELEREFRISTTDAPVFVLLDAKGEMLRLLPAVEPTADCNRESASHFPLAITRRIESSLSGLGPSLQDLERSWARDQTPKAWSNLTTRLEELKDFARLAELCEAHAEKPEWDGRKPAAWLLKALQYRLWTCFVDGAQGTAKLFELGGKILTTYPDSSEGASAVLVLWRGSSHGFDVPARSARAIQTLERYGEGLKNPQSAAFQRRMDELKSMRAGWIRRMEGVKTGTPGAGDYHLAALGDPEAAIRVYRAGIDLSPDVLRLSVPFLPQELKAYYQAMLEEAQEKLKR